MSQYEHWQGVRARLGVPPPPARRMRLQRPAKHPLWVPTVPLLPPPQPDWDGTPPAPYDEYVAPPPAMPGPFRWMEIVREVAAKHGFTIPEMRSARRGKPLVIARHEAVWRLRNETSMTLPEIGRKLGGRDHTTVLHGIKKHQERIDKGTAK